jgi:signal transduction histidine kinase
MTLRLRLFALLVALAGLLAIGEWMLVRTLAADLEEELASAAASVSQDVLRLLHLADALPSPLPAGAEGKPGAKIERRVFVMENHTVVKREPGGRGEPLVEGMPGKPLPLPPAKAAQGPSGTEEARGIVEQQTTGPDGKIITELHRVTARLEPGSAAHVVVFRGPKDTQRVPVPTSGVEHAIERFTRRLLLASLGLFGGALLLGVVLAHRFTRPLQDLAAAARRVGGGDLGVRAPAAPGEVGEAVAAFNQMSEQLLALDAETRRLRASEQLSELGEVGRGLAHSLRNPLNALGLALDQLAERAAAGEAVAGDGDASGAVAEPDAATVAATARRQIRRIDAALRGFLALSATDAAAVEVDLVAVARDVALEALQTRPGANGTPSVEVVAHSEPVRLRGVEAELRAALQALVVNAVEASPPRAAVVVTVGARRATADTGDGDADAEASPRAVISVDDEGPGIPPSVRERLFMPHVTTKAAGAGMGLYLAHRLATTRYGGTLDLADRPAGGTRATLTLSDRGAVGGEPPATGGHGTIAGAPA